MATAREPRHGAGAEAVSKTRRRTLAALPNGRFFAMRLLSTLRSTSVAVLLLAGCSGNASSPSSAMPSAVGTAGRAGAFGLAGNSVSVIPDKYLHLRNKSVPGKRQTSTAPMRGIYVSALEDSLLYGFPKNNSSNVQPICTVPATDVNGFGVDNSGNLIIPEGRSGITVWEGPAACSGHSSERSPMCTVTPLTLLPLTRSTERLPSQTFSTLSARGVFRYARWPAEGARLT